MAETPSADATPAPANRPGAACGADVAWLRALSLRERGELIESACETAAVICRSRLAAGLPPVQPAPWPESTWEFLREHAARVRG